jgi:hypothetical protein
MEKITAIRTDNSEVEKLLKEHYNIDWEIVPAEELSNGTSLDYDIDAEPLSEYDLKAFEEIKAGGFRRYQTRMLMNKLCIDGYIESGNYIIDCSW